MGKKNQIGTAANLAVAQVKKETVAPVEQGLVLTNSDASGALVALVEAPLGIVSQKDAVAVEIGEQSEMLTGYIRGIMLKKYGIDAVDNFMMNSSKLKLNGVSTPLKLPKPSENIRGVVTEKFGSFYSKCKPHIALWLEQMISNSQQLFGEDTGRIVILNLDKELIPEETAVI